MAGIAEGLQCFKFFPAEISGGIKALRSFDAPFAGITFCPTGGIREANLGDYLQQRNVRSVGGTWLVPEGAANWDWEEITRRAASALTIARATRSET